MTTVLTQFPVPPGMSSAQLRAAFAEAAPAFRQPEGLVRKCFLIAEDGSTAGGVYLWKTRAHASAFEPALREMIRTKLGVEPTLTFFETPVVVDNETGAIWTVDS